MTGPGLGPTLLKFQLCRRICSSEPMRDGARRILATHWNSVYVENQPLLAGWLPYLVSCLVHSTALHPHAKSKLAHLHLDFPVHHTLPSIVLRCCTDRVHYVFLVTNMYSEQLHESVSG